MSAQDAQEDGELHQGSGFFSKTVKPAPSPLSPQEQAAAAIQGGLDAASTTIQGGVDTARSDLQPFTAAGTQGLGDLQRNLGEIESLITDPNAQKDFVTKNPFFDALADDAQRRIFNNSAAKGKVGSGGTAEALQNSILLLGNDLVGQNVNQRSNLANQNFSLANLGANTAGSQANISGTGAINLANLEASGGETQAAGILGLENTRRQDKASKRSDGVDILKTVFSLSDRRQKHDITYLDNVGDVPYYLFKYNGSNQIQFGTMAQEVEHIPGAVVEIAGVKHVDYARL